jgi:hypothetical protein
VWPSWLLLLLLLPLPLPLPLLRLLKTKRSDEMTSIGTPCLQKG